MKMELTIILAVASIGLFHGNAIAEGPYAFSVDRFQVWGNMHGYAEDGFNDGELQPWQIDVGTAYESDGMVTLTGPGNLCSGTGIRWNDFLICEEKSEIRHEGPPLAVADGEGNFRAISTWEAIVPAQNQGYGMNCDLEAPIGVDLELITIGVLNLGPIVADIFGHQEGLYVVFERDVGGLHPENTQLFPIDEKDLTGNIRLRLWFNDSTDQFTGRFSLDGGEFQSPFLPIDSRIAEGEFADWELYGRSISIEATVALDIKPGSFPNSINLGSGGTTTVAILGSASFDVNTINPDTLTLGTAGVKTVGKTARTLCSVADVSGDFSTGLEGTPDSFDDLVCHFITMDIVPEEGATTATISGELNNGGAIKGTDSVNIVP